jgi:hypothetical protein
MIGLVFGVLAGFTEQAFCQTNLQFTSVNTTSENAIQLHWSSVSNEVYEIDYADQLAGNDDGSTAWAKLYDNYPSHGTNTFIGDFGNYFNAPAILNPNKMPMRFYRIVDKGANSGASPIVTITSTTNGASLSGLITVSVTVTSSLPFVATDLYVDGQLMDSSEDGTNYTINTCEWPNGPHLLFATAKAQSTLSGPSGSFPIDIGRGVSAYKSVTFDNLIHKIAFTQPFFEPSLGQTQQVTAAFTANVDWTLQIIDESSNAVRTVTGSGISLQYNWDGTGDGGTNIPDGVYYYSITAQTNGQAFSMMSSGGDSFSSSASALSSASEESTELWALSPDSSAPLPLAIYPPGMNTNGFTIFEASQSEVNALTEAVMGKPVKTAKSAMLMGSESSGGVMADAAYSAPSQNSVAPTRPPTNPVKNGVGIVGVAYFDHLTTNTYAVPKNGLPSSLGNAAKIQIENSLGNVEFDPIPEAAVCADKFVARMQKKGWKTGFKKGSTDFSVNDLKKGSLGGSDLFGGVNLGLFIDHGSYGTSVEQHSYMSQSKQTYFASANPADASAPWIALSEFGFGGAGNLKWMAILACNSLRDANYQSIVNHGFFPLTSDNHLLCGLTTIGAVGEDIGKFWAEKMTGGFLTSPETIRQAWYDAGHDQYNNATGLTGISSIVFRVAGWDNCLDDTLKSPPDSTSGTLDYRDQQVYP